MVASKALKNLPIGSAFSAVTNSDWEVYATAQECGRAKQRMQVTGTLEFGALLRAAMGYDRVKLVLGLQMLATGSDMSGWSTLLGWQNAYKYFDLVAPAAYWGGGGYDLGQYTKDHFPGWGPTEKTLYNTDPQTWANHLLTGSADGSGDGYTSPAAKAVDHAIERFGTMKHAMEAALRTSLVDYMPHSIGMAEYECHHHISLQGYPNLIAAQTAFAVLLRDPNFGVLTEWYFSRKRKFGGLHCAFTNYTSLDRTLAGTKIQGWPLKEYEGQTGFPIWEGYTAAIAGWDD